MTELLWRLIARFVCRPRVTAWLIHRAQRTPYSHIYGRENPNDLYMRRWWLFNPYGKGADGGVLPPRWPWLPSIRVHHIVRPDDDPHLHDHPWNARTIILKGWYWEHLPYDGPLPSRLQRMALWQGARVTHVEDRSRGYTGRLLFGQYHRIEHVAPSGAWTLFFTWRYRGTWGFMVDGQKVPYKDYFSGKWDARVKGPDHG